MILSIPFCVFCQIQDGIFSTHCFFNTFRYVEQRGGGYIMAISRSKKEEILDALVTSFSSARSIVFVKNSGLSVKDTRDIKNTLRKSEVSLSVAKKTLYAKAAEKIGVSTFDLSLLDGAVAVAISQTDEIIAAKLLGQLAKKNKNLELVGAIMDGKLVGQKEVLTLSTTPTKEESYAKIMGSALAPLSGFVRILDILAEQKS